MNDSAATTPAPAGITRVYLITGFLGSGKTTFLNHLIKSCPRGQKLLIMMNEFGEVGVDGRLVEGGPDLDMIEISKGSIFCVCVKTDFIKALHRIALQVQPDILLIESTGVANPTDLKRDLNLPFFGGRFHLAEQFCLLDALNFADEYQAFVSVEKQIASSTVFLINKTDLASLGQIETVKDLVRRHHPTPLFFETMFGQAARDFFSPTPSFQCPPAAPVEPLSETELEVALDRLLDDSHWEATPPDRLVSGVFQWSGKTRKDLDQLYTLLPPGIIRAKGFLTIDGETRLLNLIVGRPETSPASLPVDRREVLNKLVFIAAPEVMTVLESQARGCPVIQRLSGYLTDFSS